MRTIKLNVEDHISQMLKEMVEAAWETEGERIYQRDIVQAAVANVYRLYSVDGLYNAIEKLSKFSRRKRKDRNHNSGGK